MNVLRDGPLEKWWEAGGEFSASTNLFFAHCLCRNFFSGETLCTNLFFRQILLFLNSKILILNLCFYALWIILHSQQINGYRPLFNAKTFRKCTHSERGGSHLEWTASLCIFSVLALWNSSPTAHHNDAILHSLHTLIQGTHPLFNKTHPLIFVVGTNNFIEYLQRYQILIFIYLLQILFYYVYYNTVYGVNRVSGWPGRWSHPFQGGWTSLVHMQHPAQKYGSQKLQALQRPHPGQRCRPTGWTTSG